MQYVGVYATWLAAYPQFTTTVTTQAQYNQAFALAQMYCSNPNDGAGVPYVGQCSGPVIPYDTTQTPPIVDRQLILDLLTAHIAAILYGYVAGGSLVPPGTIVGRVSNASQGSVSVGTDFPQNPSAAWFNQTPFGAMAFSMMGRYRTARYRASPGRFYQGVYGRGVPWGNGYYGQ